MSSNNQWLNDALDKRKGQGLYRHLPDYSGLVDFCSNDYLGIARNPELENARKHVLNNYSDECTHGSTGSRLISGNSTIAVDTESLVARYHKAEAALLFSTGYAANVGLLSAVAGRGDTIITDELIHASLIDGARLSHAQRLRFEHNNVDDLKSKLQKAKGRCFVVIESVYSMDGDMAPMKDIVHICTEFDAFLIVDEAHAIGVFGKNGEGMVSEAGLENEVWARVVTYGKAMGIHGAAILGSTSLIHYLINFSRSFIYSTALPKEAYGSIQASYKLVEKAHTERKQLEENISYFKKQATSAGLNVLNSDSAIQGVLVRGNKEGKEKENDLRRNGMACKAILSPTVPEGRERLRVSLHAFNTLEEIDLLIKTLKEA